MTTEPVLPNASRDHCRGPPTAKLSLIEYTDYESEPCAEAHWVLKKLEEELGDEVCVVVRNLPLSMIHPNAQAAAEAAEAADAQGKFWLMHDRLFEHQDQLETAHLEKYAREISLDMATFDRDLRSGAPARRVAEDVASAQHHGVRGTPTFFVNGTPFLGPGEFLPLLKALRGSAADHDRFDP
ncbi:MAG: DsbA family protein [Thermoplasmata archaeon]|nr:DsbA family protein [Thermoplasmata archaeon]